MKFKDVEFIKCVSFDPFHPKADFTGTRWCWRADYQGMTIVTLCDTKKECMEEVRRYIASQR